MLAYTQYMAEYKDTVLLTNEESNAGRSPSVFFEGRTYKQWAEDLGIHLNTVRNRLKQGKHPNKLIIIKA